MGREAVHIMVGVLLAIALLYFWLIGHWFARVLEFLMFAPLLACQADLRSTGPN